MELFIDHRWLLDRQEELLGKELGVNDYSGLVAAVARHRVNTPRLDVGDPDIYWRAAALLDTIVLQRPLPARNELYGYGVAVAYVEACGESLEASYEQWRDLIADIRALRLDVYDTADRLRSWRAADGPTSPAR
ncbi:toxin Doc [Streptomyces aculeolatus]